MKVGEEWIQEEGPDPTASNAVLNLLRWQPIETIENPEDEALIEIVPEDKEGKGETPQENRKALFPG